MRGAAKGSWTAGAIASMLQSSGPSSTILIAHGATAAIDVTGFGLAGHLIEMVHFTLCKLIKYPSVNQMMRTVQIRLKLRVPFTCVIRMLCWSLHERATLRVLLMRYEILS